MKYVESTKGLVLELGASSGTLEGHVFQEGLSVIYINEYAHSLINITFPDTVHTMSIFFYDLSLVGIRYPPNLHTLKYYFLKFDPIADIDFPDTLKVLGLNLSRDVSINLLPDSIEELYLSHLDTYMARYPLNLRKIAIVSDWKREQTITNLGIVPKCIDGTECIIEYDPKTDDDDEGF
ncbi:MAG: hypothetical protein Gaeavirus27_4 [Gaeavirus sp.]|uniref:Uncharacterized protein n=1 Tax=Gaeavirus sp. TaxID=2487767 RepID=A0A3G4ZZG4_9VIRU|nr:MAG: hypothetical protein Gaeavirus27_4 [Gaeavirus sp.]